MNPVTEVPPAESPAAIEHFGGRLSFETDAADVAAALATGEPGFVLLDARDADAYAAGHLPGACHLARPLDPAQVAALPPGPVVVYCWGPGCNGAVKAALDLARMGRPVKEMLGGFEYWVREGHQVAGTGATAVSGDVVRTS
jgi:rhodanese-related sulfurtransferase